MTDEEESDTSYTAPPQYVSDRLTGDINVVFGEGVIGAMAHPGQENRRRALLAFQLLLLHRTETAADALAAVLSALHEPALLSWLLSVVVDVDSVHPVVADRCQNILQRHGNSPYLTVRAFAARILGDDASPPPLTPPDAALLPSGRLLLPDDDPLFDRTAAGVTFVAAAHRLTAAEELLPHIIRAVIVRVDAAMADHEHMKAIDKEANELADVRHERWADAFTGRPALVEDALQRAASGGRAALLAAGEPPADPAAWEYSLARVLVNDPALPLAIERTRQPRPDIIMPPTAGDPVWSGAHEVANRGRWPESADAVVTASSLAPAESCDILRTGRFRGWRIIALRLSPMTGHRISCHESETLTIADTGFVRGEVAECRM